MPLTHLGQLRPTMQQQIALQRRLLALQREDEEMRRKAAGQRAGAPVARPKSSPFASPAYGGNGVQATGGPEQRPREAFRGGMQYSQPSANPLKSALTANTPTPDWQQEAWDRRTEIVAERKDEFDKEADALYGIVQKLGKDDQDRLLSEVVNKDSGKTTPSTISVAMDPTQRALMHEELHEREPSWDKTEPIGPQEVTVKGTTGPLLQTLIDKHYVRSDEKGGYSWMLPEEEKKVINVSTWTDESGWLQQTTTFDDGTSKTENLGREAKEVEKETGPTISEKIAIARYNDDKAKAAKGQGDKIIEKALEMTGTKYGVGEVLKNGLEITQNWVDNWDKRFTDNYNMMLELFGNSPSIPTGDLSLDMIPDTSPEVAQRKEKIALHKAQYEDRPDIIMTIENELGLPITGKWSPQLEFMLYTRGMGGK